MAGGVHVRSISEGSLGLGAGNGKEESAQNAILLDVLAQDSQAVFQFTRKTGVFRGGFAHTSDASAVNGNVNEAGAGTAAEVEHPGAEQFRVIAGIC